MNEQIEKDRASLNSLIFEKDSDTFPKLLRRNFQNYPEDTTMRHKRYGLWNQYTWKDCFINVRNIGLGLVSLGLNKGDKVCIIGNCEPEWYWAELAVQSVGSVTVGLYTDAIVNELEYIVDHSDATYAFARDQEQVDKFLNMRNKILRVKKVIYWEPKGMWSYKSIDWVMDIKELMKLGEEYNEKNPQFFDESISNGKYDDLSILSYTSGTTGLPKGALSGYDMTLYAAKKFEAELSFQANDQYVSFLPPAWVAEQLFGIAPWLELRVIVNFPEKSDTIWDDLREIGPTYCLLGPAQANSFLKQVQIRVNDTHPIKRLIYNISLKIGHKIADSKNQNGSIRWIVLRKLADWACLMHIRDYLGLRFLKIVFTGGSILGPDTFRWFRAIGVNLSEIYGLSEATPLTMHGKDVKAGTVGKCFPGVDVRHSEGLELQFKYPYPFKGYYKNEEATKKTIQDGWLSTGDAGTIDKDGHVIIYDRVKDMMELKDGTKYSGPFIENRVKFSPYIKECLVVGGENMDYLSAIIIIDFANLGRWAEKNRIPYTTFVDLCQKDEVYNLFLGSLQEINQALEPKARLKKFVNLYKEFDPDEGELTRSGKIKRLFLYNKYEYLIQKIYEGSSQVSIKAEVVYHDGKKGSISANLRIMDIPDVSF